MCTAKPATTRAGYGWLWGRRDGGVGRRMESGPPAPGEWHLSQNSNTVLWAWSASQHASSKRSTGRTVSAFCGWSDFGAETRTSTRAHAAATSASVATITSK
jgi:hypothetical protein